ncbi:choice-of-anchor M domain-containing protein [Corynebacterium riegelii]|uniref:choice-of-anchor M domain-containing protein n=1 Tax=Corynebacterium riegelii TaxID=156976 RepID=UPI00215341A3|nr:choice-of-anchor M domain-containing protein [Corynebacterium riegelii]
MRTRFPALAVILTFLFIGAPLALAESATTDGKVVRTQTHVDSPHAVWEDGNFRLMSNSAGLIPIENTVNWVSRGRADGGLGAYAWKVPDDPRFDFLGVEPGHLMYFGGPAHGFPKNTMPIWAGFGAAADLPTNQFRAESFNMEIVGFSGPGKMELFNYSDETYPLTRLWSSHDPGFRSTWVNAGTHTHNSTTFTRPGLYEVTYRGTARKKDGSFLHSAPQTLTWQVGGTDPAQRTITDIVAAYNAAPSIGTGTPTFSIAPSTASTKGAEQGVLSTLTFETGNPNDAGHVQFFINGFYLAERKVTGGTATWDEMLGDDTSELQAVYLPSTSSPTPRWVSAPLRFRTGDTKTATRDGGEVLPSPSMEPIPAFGTDPLTLTSPDVTVSTSAVYGEDMRNIDITVESADPRTTLRVTGGFYRMDNGPLTTMPRDAIADCEVDFTSAPGSRKSKQLIDGCQRPNYQLLLRLIPESRSNAADAALVSVPHTDAYAPIPGTTVRLGGGGSEESSSQPTEPSEPVPSAPTAPSEPAPSEPAPTAPSEPVPSEGQALNLSSGHVDIAPYYDNDVLHLRIKDETNLHQRGAVWRRPNDVYFTVPSQVSTTLPESIEGFAEKGTTAYILPETQRSGVVWPGLSSEHAYSQTKQDYTFTFTPLSAPDGGKWIAFRGNQTSPQDRLAGSDSTRAYTTEGPEHMHVSWAFSKPGTYEIGVWVAEKGGTPSQQEVLRFVVAPDAKPDTIKEITTGHIDFGPKLIDATPHLLINEDDQHHAPETVVLRVKDNRKVTANGAIADSLSFTGIVERGASIYHLPLMQDRDSIWPGWDTFRVAEQYPAGVNVEVRPRSTPKGGAWWAGHIPSLGVPERTLASSTGTHTISGVSEGPFHIHADWVFTKPGTYTMDMRAVDPQGKAVTEWSTITYLVGNATTEPEPAPGSPAPGSPAPSSPAPSPAPSPSPSGTTKPTQPTQPTQPTTSSTTPKTSTQSTTTKPTTTRSTTQSTTTQRTSAQSATTQSITAQAASVGGGGSGGSLASTGASVMLPVGVAMLCLMACGALITRRRR